MLAKQQSITGLKPSFKTKSKGAYSACLRRLSRSLVMSGVSTVQVPTVIRMCARAFGVKLGSVPSPRSIGRIVLEGGAAAKVQAGNLLANAQGKQAPVILLQKPAHRAKLGVTTSMDSTSQRNINFSSMHMMANSEGTHKQLYLAVDSTPDHTSKTQVDTLKNTIQDICDTTERAPKCGVSPGAPPCAADIARKLYGANGDHAKDQLKVAQLEKQWKIESWVDYLGTLMLQSLGKSESESFYQSIQTSSETRAGGSEVFTSLDLDAQDDLRATEYQRGIHQLGNEAFNNTSPVLQLDMSCLVRGGCCAHKDMNAVKGGAAAMLTFWKENKHLQPPVKLFNKDNDATVLLADSSSEMTHAEQRAITETEAGAIKLCSLAGAAFNHKDDKKGHQDSHVYWFSAKYKHFHRFPDTSNVRYGSYVDAATELCTLHGAYIDYMDHSRQKKAAGTLNHLESNILKALNCPATLSELLVLSLYGQTISKPYMRLVHMAAVEGKGIADLAPLHAQVQSHLEAIIANPSLLLSPSAFPALATLDNSEWENPEVLTALQIHGPKLPYLEDLLVAFCHGALHTWVRFTEEFAVNGPIASLTPEQHKKAFMPPTNDANEGALGTWRVWTRRFPRTALHRFNAIIMNRANDTEAYIDENFTSEQHTWLRSEARRIDSSKLEETRKTQLVSAAINEAERNQALLSQRADRRRIREEHIAGIELILDQEAILKLKGSELDDQLKVYKQCVVLANGETFPVISKLKVVDKRKLVVGLALKYVQGLSSHEMASPQPTA